MSEYLKIQSSLKQVQRRMLGNPQISEIDTAQPCIDCKFCVRCRDEAIACEEFARWVSGLKRHMDAARRRPRRPSKRWMEKKIGRGRSVYNVDETAVPEDWAW